MVEQHTLYSIEEMHESITEKEHTDIIIPGNEVNKLQTEAELVDEECQKSEYLINELQQENNVGNYFSTAAIKLASLKSECKSVNRLKIIFCKVKIFL